MDSHDITRKALESPKFANGEDYAVQQGAGMVVTKASDAEIQASLVFLKWFTSPEHNITFSVDSGYLPVTHEGNSIDAIRISGLALSDEMDEVLSAAVDTVNENHLYTPRAFSGGTNARAILEYRALKRPRRSSFPTNALKPGIRIRLHRLRPFRAE